MSTFDGRIREYPVIAIDNFAHNDFSKYFILSHVHSDHMRGLDDILFNKKIYCTEESAKIIPYIAVRHNGQPKYRHLVNLLVPVKYNQVVKLDTIEYGILSFQFLPANHCIGSAMVLIEGTNGSILYTGDTRAEPEFFEKQLQIIKRRRIQNLYMDTTCLREEQDLFISKRRSIELLVNLIRDKEEHHHIYIDCWTFGYEECWAHVADSFNQKIHVSQLKYDTFVSANPIYKDYLTTNPTETRFHSCDWELDCQQHEHGLVVIHFKPTIDDQPRVYIHSTTSNQLLKSDLNVKCKPQIRHILPFSFHSSCSEIADFVKFVNAKTFTASVARGGYAAMDRMRQVLTKKGCKIGVINHSSDIGSTDSSPQKRRKTSSAKIYSETQSDPDSHSSKGSSGGSTWVTNPTSKAPSTAKSSKSTITGGSLLAVSRYNITSVCEETHTTAQDQSVSSTRHSKSNLKSNSRPHSYPSTVHPLGDVTNEIRTSSVHQEKSQHEEDDIQSPSYSCSSTLIEMEVIPLSPIMKDPDPEDTAIVISSDDEDSKPIMTRKEKRRFFRALRKCHVERNDFIMNVQA